MPVASEDSYWEDYEQLNMDTAQMQTEKTARTNL